jgi:hypothetical protein
MKKNIKYTSLIALTVIGFTGCHQNDIKPIEKQEKIIKSCNYCEDDKPIIEKQEKVTVKKVFEEPKKVEVINFTDVCGNCKFPVTIRK